MRRSLLAMIVLVTWLASPAMALACEMTCDGHRAHAASGHAMTPGHERHSAQHQSGHAQHHATPAGADRVTVQSHECDHAALLPALPELVVASQTILLAATPVVISPLAGPAPVRRSAAAKFFSPPSIASPPLRI